MRLKNPYQINQQLTHPPNIIESNHHHWPTEQKIHQPTLYYICLCLQIHGESFVCLNFPFNLTILSAWTKKVYVPFSRHIYSSICHKDVSFHPFRCAQHPRNGYAISYYTLFLELRNDFQRKKINTFSVRKAWMGNVCWKRVGILPKQQNSCCPFPFSLFSFWVRWENLTR